jgi:hypothetical protein
MFKILSTYSCSKKYIKMQHLEDSGTPVLYTGRTVLKGSLCICEYSRILFEALPLTL